RIGVTFSDDAGDSSDDANSGLFEAKLSGGTFADVPRFDHSLSVGNVSRSDKPSTVLDLTGGGLDGNPNWATADSDTVGLQLDVGNLENITSDSYSEGDYTIDFWVYQDSIPS
ncbi:hypothetical protein KGY79_13295, partial [Candidatus Bipolaricaulota bacterium]|nr:hypothetical protein [Candidatus Bipolaricaulota bacterium]